MAHEYTDNNGTTFKNINHCRTFKRTLVGALTALHDEVCSEVIVINRAELPIVLYDNGFVDTANGMLLSAAESFTMRGVTNANQISAIGAGDVVYRTQWYSNSPAR